MTDEEYFRKHYPDFCYGDKPLSPYWDLFQYGVEFGERQSEKKIEELELELTVEKDLHQEETNLHLHAEEYIKSLEQQIEKMKCCSNCNHFNKEEDNEYCWNCERHLINSLDNLKAEEIIKDEWELEND